MSELVDIDLTQDERAFALQALTEWFGPARPSATLVQAMGFANLEEFPSEMERLLTELRDRRPLSARDWARVLVAVEIAFASDYYGSGWDFVGSTGRDDGESILVLRAIQAKLIATAKTVQL